MHRAIIWALPQENIAGRKLQQELGIGYTRADELLK